MSRRAVVRLQPSVYESVEELRRKTSWAMGFHVTMQEMVTSLVLEALRARRAKKKKGGQ